MTEPLEPRTLLSVFIIGPSYVNARVFNDLNGSGTRQANEPWLAGVTVVASILEFDNSNGSNLINRAEATTDANGFAVFDASVEEGAYKSLTANLLAGQRQSTNNLPQREGKQRENPQLIGVTTRPRVSGRVIDDVNGNRVINPEDAPVPGRRVFDDVNGNGALDANEPVVVTDRLGRWSFGTLLAGHHSFRLESTGFAQTSPIHNAALDLTLVHGQVSNDNNFAQRGAIVRGTVFNDLDGNSLRSASEAGAGNFFVYDDANSSGTFDAGETSTRTAADGTFTLAGLRAGATVIRTETRSGYPGTAGANGLLIVAQLDAVTNLSFGQQGVLISGQSYFDVNGDGVYDKGDFGSGGVWIDSNDNRKKDPGELTAVLGSGPNYSFPDLPAGTYIIRANTGSYIEPGPPIQMQPTARTDSAYQFTLAPGDARVHRDFVFNSPISISGNVFVDRNLNGKMEADEQPLDGWTVFVDMNGNGAPDAGEPTAITSKGLPFSFIRLRPGTYTVRVVPQDSWTFAGGGAVTFTQTAGAKTVTANIGARAGRIHGNIFFDTDGDGVHTAGDGAGYEGSLYAWIDLNNNGEQDTNEPSDYVTGTTYSFDGLVPGHYVVHVGTAIDYPVIDHLGGDAVSFDLATGQDTTHDFIFVPPAFYSGRVFNDVNGNGLYDGVAEDIPIMLLVYADYNDDGIRQENEPEAILQDHGVWSMETSPGRMVIRVQQVSNWRQTFPTGAGAIVHNLKSGQASKNNNFAMVPA